MLSVGDPGPFCLARGGIYCRELGAWIIFLVFKGNDIHSGFAPTDDEDFRRDWVDSHLNAAWDYAGPENRQGYVLYQSSAATNRNAGMNMSPLQLFGNFGASQPNRLKQNNFASHGFVSLGGEHPWANRMGREAVLAFYNELRSANLSSSIDFDDLLKSISYSSISGTQVSLDPLPYHPIQNQSTVKKNLSYYSYLRSECNAMYIHVNRHDFIGWQSTRLQKGNQATFDPIERHSIIPSLEPNTTQSDNAAIDIECVVGRKLLNGIVSAHFMK